MKKVFILTILFILVIIVTTSCSSQTDNRYIPNGYINKEEHYDVNGFQDYTDYAKYTYYSKDIILNNNDYKKVTSNDFESIKNYLENFRGWMETDNRLDEYDFDENIINEGDYFCIINENDKEINYLNYDNYSIYYFDVETLTLYYMHNNI